MPISPTRSNLPYLIKASSSPPKKFQLKASSIPTTRILIEGKVNPTKEIRELISTPEKVVIKGLDHVRYF